MADDDMLIQDAEVLLETAQARALPEQPFKGSLEEYIKKKQVSVHDLLRSKYAETGATFEEVDIEERAVFFNQLILEILKNSITEAGNKVRNSLLGHVISLELFSWAKDLVSEYNQAINKRS